MGLKNDLKTTFKPTVSKPQAEVYTAGHAKSFLYMSLPSGLTTLYGLLACGSISGLAYFAGDRLDPSVSGGRGGFFWFSVAVGVMTVFSMIGMGIKGARGKKEQRQGEEFEGALKEAAGGWGDADDDAAEIQRLDDLRSNFQKGMETFREYGKDVYSMPWYVIVGEPGSGKTEAIRHSDLKFPDALQDKLQGTGGTYSMHWWFTNHAVLLDTAGAMLMNSEAGERFAEFLKLLRRWRPDCPINGLLLTIPVDSLLMDDMATSEEKARTIAEQLSIIQKTLDLRFPIYLMITKSDRLPGFREFCDANGQDKFERQMVGWSNEADLDVDFRAGSLDQALEGLTGRLQNRRMALLSDPIPRKPGVRRLDEVDSLYTFPDTIQSLLPRLKRYLEILFQSGEWARKTPFFRGLYFTSAMREGATLDEELASAMGMPLNQLPQGGVWSEQKSLFLKDLFMEKVFKEKGLVTRLVDIGKTLRKRLLWLFGTVATILILLLLSAFLVQRGIEKDLDDDNKSWVAANNNWENGKFLSFLSDTPVTKQELPQWRWMGTEAGISGRDNCPNRFALLEMVEQKSRSGLSWGWVFKPLPAFRKMEHSRRDAWRYLFEGAVAKPVLDAARQKMSTLGASGSQLRMDTRAARALAAFVELEAAVDDEKRPAYREGQFTEIFTPLYEWVCDGAIKFPADEMAGIEKMAALCYTEEFPFGSRKWMSERQYLSKDNGKGSGLTTDQEPIQAGSNFFFASSEQVSVDAEAQKLLQIQRLDAARQFKEAEDALATLADEEQSKVTFNEVEGWKIKLEEANEQIRKVESPNGRAAARLDPDEVGRLSRKMEVACKSSHSDVLEVIRRRLNELKSDSGDTPKEEEKGLALDFLHGAAQERLTAYQKALQPVKAGPPIRLGKLKEFILDRKNAPAVTPALSAEEEKKSGKAYEGRRKVEYQKITSYLKKEWAKNFIISNACEQYLPAAQAILNAALHFPLVLPEASAKPLSQAEFIAQCTNLWKLIDDKVQLSDMNSEDFPECVAKSNLEAFYSQLDPVFQIVRALSESKPGAISLGTLTVTVGPSPVARMLQPKQELIPGTPGTPGTLPGMQGTAGTPPVVITKTAELDPEVTRVSFHTGIGPTLSPSYDGPPVPAGAPVTTKPKVNAGFLLDVFGNYDSRPNVSYLRGGPIEERAEWGILHWLLEKKAMFGDDTPKITTTLVKANPPREFVVDIKFASPLPANNAWPKRTDFSFLPENKAPTLRPATRP